MNLSKNLLWKNVEVFKLNHERKLHLRMVLYTMASGLELINMAMVFKDGLTGHAMKVCGKILRLVAKENFGTLMVIFSKENGLMIKQMALEFILIQMVQVIQVFGKMISKMEKEKNIG
jgi:hypothetical protein